MTVYFDFIMVCSFWQWLGVFLPCVTIGGGLISIAGAMIHNITKDKV